MGTMWGPQGCGDHVGTTGMCRPHGDNMETTWGQHEDNVETTWGQHGDHRDVGTMWRHGDNVGTMGMWRPCGDNMETT